MSHCIASIASLDFLPQAVVALESAQRGLPGVRTRVLLVLGDSLPEALPAALPNIRFVTESELPERVRREAMRRYYTKREYAWAMKPHLLRYLLQIDDCENVVYLDADTYTYPSAEGAVDLVRPNDVCLYPHLFPCAGGTARKHSFYQEQLFAGLYNGGVISGRRSDSWIRFLDFWIEKLWLHGRIRPDVAEYGDQRWLDLIPRLFDHVTVSNDRTINLGPWRLNSMSLNGGSIVDEANRAVAVAHFSGVLMHDEKKLFRWVPTASDALVSAWSEAAHTYRELVRARAKDIGRILGDDLVTAGPDRSSPGWQKRIMHSLAIKGWQPEKIVELNQFDLWRLRAQRLVHAVAFRMPFE